MPCTPACARCSCDGAARRASRARCSASRRCSTRRRSTTSCRVAPGYSPHQDAPAYPMIDAHVSAMIAVDDADADNGGLEVVSGCFDRVLPIDERGCIDAGGRRGARVAAGDGARRPRRSGSTAARHTAAGPTGPTGPAGALYPTYNAAREGDRRAEYYDDEARRVRGDGTRATARWSRSSATSRDGRREGRVHRARRAAGSPRRRTSTRRCWPQLARASRCACRARRRAVMTSATYPNHATFATGDRPRDARHRHQLGAADRVGVVPAWKLGRAVPTLFDACRAARSHRARRSFGDQHLVGVMGATCRRPRTGRPTACRRPTRGSTRTGYVDDRDTIVRARRRARRRDPTCVVSQLNGARHRRARATAPTATPRSTATATPTRCSPQIARAPRLGRHGLDPRVRPRPGDRSTTATPIDLQRRVRRAVDSTCSRSPRAARPWSAATAPRRGATWLTDVDGIDGTGTVPRRRRRRSSAAWRGACPGAPSASPRWTPSRGTHGGPRTRTQVAVVTGGHPLGRAARAGARDTTASTPPTGPRRSPRCSTSTSADRAPGTVAHSDRVSRFTHAAAIRRATTAVGARCRGRARPCRAPWRRRRPGGARRGRRARAAARTRATSSGAITPPWKPSVISLRAESSVAVRGIGGEQVALGGDVPTDEDRDTRPEQPARPARGRRRRARRRGAASSRPARARATRGRAPGPRPAARRRRGATRGAASAHCRQWSRIESPPSSSAWRDASSAANSSSTSAKLRVSQRGRQRARGTDRERDEGERRAVAGRRREHRRVGDHHVVDVPEPLPRVAHRRARRRRPCARCPSSASTSVRGAGRWCPACPAT